MPVDIKTPIRLDGRSRTIPYTTDEMREDVINHKLAVLSVVEQLLQDLKWKAQVMDSSILNNIEAYTDQINTSHMVKRPKGDWFKDVHAATEQHHWDIYKPSRPAFVNLVLYLVDRMVAGIEENGKLPDRAQLDSDTVRDIVKNLEDDIATILGAER